MKNFLLLSLTCFLAVAFVGCGDDKPMPNMTQPTAGNEPPKYAGGSAKGGPLGRMQGKAAASQNLSDKKASEP